MTPADEAVLRAAQQHADTHQHRTVFVAGQGWLCEVCDDDLPEFLAGEWAIDQVAPQHPAPVQPGRQP